MNQALRVTAICAALAGAACGQPTVRPPKLLPPPSTPEAQAAAQPSRPEPPVVTQSLYRRLGGYDVIAAVTDDFLGRMLGDPRMAAYFEQVDDKGRKRVRQMIVDQLCAATGGPCVYVGADMATAHKGLQISETAWTVAAGYLAASLEQLRVLSQERAEVLAIVTSLKADIVGK